MTKQVLGVLGVFILPTVLGAFAGEVGFAAKPAVKKDGAPSTGSGQAGAKISFAVTAPTDVEVAVLDAQGRIVRHLAAGVLGGTNAPPEPLKSGLAQELVWDGKDDMGKVVAADGAKVRVRAGMRATFGKILGFDPYRMVYVHGLMTDEKGSLYVMFRSELNFGSGPMRIRVFDRDGKYLRTIFPYSADLPPEKVAGFGQYTGKGKDDGYLYPVNSDPLSPKIYPCSAGDDFSFVGHRVRQGRIVLFTPSGAHGGTSHTVYQLATDGSCPDGKWALGRLWSGWGEKPPEKDQAKIGGGPWCWAVSPDGKMLYFAGLDAEPKRPTDYAWAPGRVHKIDLTKPVLPVERAVGVLPKEKFVDTLPEGAKAAAGQGRNDWGTYVGLGSTMGLDVDESGNVYVCERAAKRVAAYDPAGTLLGATAVDDPDVVAVHPKTKELYVLTRKQPGKRNLSFELVKFSGVKEGKELARFAFKGTGASAGNIALDASGGKPVLWIAGPGGENKVWRLEDAGAEFKPTGELSGKASPDGIDYAVYSWANPVNDQVFVNSGYTAAKVGTRALQRLDGLTGSNLAMKVDSALSVAFDLAGNVYLGGGPGCGYMSPVYRYAPDMTPLPFPGTGKPETGGKPLYGKFGVGDNQKGLAVGPDGALYGHHMATWALHGVISWKPDGTQDKEVMLITGMDAGGIKVDLKNNLYLGLNGVPKDYDGPACHGSVVKMPMENARGVLNMAVKSAEMKGTDGDALKVKNAVAAIENEKGPNEKPGGWPWKIGDRPAGPLRGVVAAYPGVAPLSARQCSCKEVRFDLDRYGRLYLPNTFTFSVQVVDNAGSEITRFGHYGNADSQGPGSESPVKKPEIPLGWPMTVSATESDHVYVGDYLNTRVVRVDLKYAAEETVAIK